MGQAENVSLSMLWMQNCRHAASTPAGLVTSNAQAGSLRSMISTASSSPPPTHLAMLQLLVQSLLQVDDVKPCCWNARNILHPQLAVLRPLPGMCEQRAFAQATHAHKGKFSLALAKHCCQMPVARPKRTWGAGWS
jgi:hypothetical protein